MSLPVGTRYKSRVIVGLYHPGYCTSLPTPDDPISMMEPVAKTLREHHNVKASIVPATYQLSGFFRLNQESLDVTADRHGGGLIVRIVQGAANLKVNDHELLERAHLDYGDWLHVPPGISIRLTGAMVIGQNLRFATIQLNPAK